MKSIQAQIDRAVSGQTINVSPGLYKRFHFDQGWGVGGLSGVFGLQKDSPPIIVRNPLGGSNTISVRDARSVDLANLIVDVGDEAAGVMTYTKKMRNRLGLQNILFDGGWNGDLNVGRKGAKWGLRSNHTRVVEADSVVGQNIYKEHLFYIGVNEWIDLSTPIRHIIRLENSIGRRLGRTFLQAVSYEGEGKSPEELYASIVNCMAIDTCITGGGGGSAFTFRGGFDKAIIYLDGISSFQGCDPSLNPKSGQNITGHLVVDLGGYINPQPFSCDTLVLNDYNFVTGLAYPGVGSARRPFIQLEKPRKITIGSGKLKAGEGVLPIAMTIQSAPEDVRNYTFLEAARNTWQSNLRCYFDGTKFDNYGVMIDALRGAKGIHIL